MVLQGGHTPSFRYATKDADRISVITTSKISRFCYKGSWPPERILCLFRVSSFRMADIAAHNVPMPQDADTFTSLSF